MTLWGADGTSPFFIKNADTTCMIPPHGMCTAASGDVVNVLRRRLGAAAIATMSDQYYPATNGNNVYFALQQAAGGGSYNLAWLGNASAASTSGWLAQLLTPRISGSFLRRAVRIRAVAFLSGLAVDPTDPANIVLYSSDDDSGIGTLAQGMWFESCLGNPPAVLPASWDYTHELPNSSRKCASGCSPERGSGGGNNSVTVSWSPAQVNQPVTSYTVINSSRQTASRLRLRLFHRSSSGA